MLSSDQPALPAGAGTCVAGQPECRRDLRMSFGKRGGKLRDGGSYKELGTLRMRGACGSAEFVDLLSGWSGLRLGRSDPAHPGEELLGCSTVDHGTSGF